MRLVNVLNETRGTLVGDRVTVADTSLTRLFGLLPKRGLDAGEGLWIKPSSGVHTFFMRFTIDVVPYRVTSVSTKIASVIELPAGTIRECQVQVGDVLSIT